MVDPHLVATFPTLTYDEAHLWATMELMNTLGVQTKVTILLIATLEGAKSSGSILAKEVVIVDGNTTLQYSLAPVCIFIYLFISLFIYF